MTGGAGGDRDGASLLRSSAFQLAAMQAGLFALIALLLFAITWWSVRGYVEAQVRRAISDEFSEVVAAPAGNRATAIAGMVAQAPQGPLYYGLFDRGGHRIAGDLSHMPAGPGWGTLTQAVPPRDRSRVLVHAEWLDDGRLLAIGRDRRSADKLDALLQEAFLWAGAASVFLALLGGVFTARSYLRRVEAVATAAARIAAGDLGVRVSGSGRGDEFDRLAQALNGMLERIQVLVEGVRQVSSDIAHDLRTPLAHLRQRLESATRTATDVPTFRAAAERALADVDGVLATFAALLRIAQVESRQRRAGFSAVDLSALLDSLVGDYAPLMEDQGRVLHANLDRNIHMLGDRALLTQMFVNLIENALRHTPPGTPVTLALERQVSGCRITLADAGPGIPAEARGRVVGRFVRLDAARSTPGSGLGLALVAAVVDLHGATLAFGDARPGLQVQLEFPTSGASRP
ncbi:MAG: two-component sensor histidine kinase [Rhodanobacter sp. 68-29]|nr:HAMP domain-containing histidine kinase [Rhodanobacter sp.]ODU74654.1 MAG: two-component sensor histidine kinase [Rhodanobacter sp. SCN 69-32]OJY58131.1 MAG: two-component sensor histidine kinase [Rhodanobacter sp. 68-29]